MKIFISISFALFFLTYSHAEKIDFNRDIRPILSDKCFHCHGPDSQNQKSDLRLDTREHALMDLDGTRGIVPGQLKESEVHWRIRAPRDDIDLMPPADSNRFLTEREKDLLDQWIEEGGEYDLHWSFKKPKRGQRPELSERLRDRSENAIDYFIFSKLEEENLQPTAEASLETRMRRAALTLTGLPPTADSLDQAKKLSPEKAYSQYVDELLSSIDYAEKQTLRWLDAARYADTDGYQNDAERKNWPWRDWVIQAFHDNMPFDQFTIEQIAGDMLPDATPEQILASAFNRNHRQNSEGGALAEEFFVENVIDRVETTSTVWLGLTMGCARCHDHKYDPLSQKEFFQFYAYFNNIGEKGIGKGVSANPTELFSSPLLEAPLELRQRNEAAKEKLSDAKKRIPSRALAWAAKRKEAFDTDSKSDWSPSEITSAKASGGTSLKKLADGTWLAGKSSNGKSTFTITINAASQFISGLSIDALPHESLTAPLSRAPSSNGNFVLSEVKVIINDATKDEPIPVKFKTVAATFEQPNYSASQAADGKLQTGWAISGIKNSDSNTSLFLLFEEPFDLPRKTTITLEMIHNSNFGNHHVGRFRVNQTSAKDPALKAGMGLSPDVFSAVRQQPDKRTKAQIKLIEDHYRPLDEDLAAAEKELNSIQRELEKGGFHEVPVMVMREKTGEAVPAYLLERGQYDAPDKSEVLSRAVPAALFSGPEESHPEDRLGLAKWLVSKENPITARVIVNRIWRDHFGRGLVATVEDFGAQSENPTHPELLDWLAVEFIESGWDLKALHRLIVTSATFQQGSMIDSTLLSQDPTNRFLARGPRYRMDGFAIRDTALQAAGLLNRTPGGPPVKPYQPEGLWNAVSSGAGTRYRPDTGEKLYRKSLYTYWKRAVNPPRQLIFDAGGREACNVNTRRTNTPLQALVLMNDVTFVESARKAAERVLLDNSASTDEQRLKALYRNITAYTISEESKSVLEESLAHYRKHFSENGDKAEAFLSNGESPSSEILDKPTHAAWTSVAHLILNLDKTVTIE